MTTAGPARPVGLSAQAGLVLIGILAAGLLLWSTPWGLGLGGDSYYYVSGARSLLAGEGFARPAADGSYRPITHFPPMYSLVLAAIGRIGFSLLPGARILHAILFGASAALTGWLVWRGTSSLLLACVGSLLFALLPAIQTAHSWLLSESLFLFFALLMAAWAVHYLGEGRQPGLLIAGVAAGLAVLTRYAGLALVLSGAFVLGTWPGRVGRKRWADVGLWLVLGLSGWFVWSGRNAIEAGSVTNRGISLHLPDMEKLVEGLSTAGRWLFPARLPVTVSAAVVVGVAVWVVIAATRRLASGRGEPSARAVLGISLAIACVYPLFLLTSLSFVDASTPLDDRILSPLVVFGLIIALCTMAPAIAHPGPRRWLGIAGVAALLVLTGVRGVRKAIQLHEDGQGYAGRAWRNSQVVAWVANLDPGVILYSNELDILYLYTGRQAFQVPIRWDPVREAPREDFEGQLSSMRERVLEQGAVVVLFDTISEQQAFLPPEDVLVEGFVAVFDAGDGAVYAAPQ